MLNTVLIVDDDLGFAFWLGQALDRAGIESWPARSVYAANSLLAQLPLTIDLLIISDSLPWGGVLADRLGRARTNFKLIVICDKAGQPHGALNATAVYQRPQAIDHAESVKWVQRINDVLAAEERANGHTLGGEHP